MLPISHFHAPCLTGTILFSHIAYLKATPSWNGCPAVRDLQNAWEGKSEEEKLHKPRKNEWMSEWATEEHWTDRWQETLGLIYQRRSECRDHGTTTRLCDLWKLRIWPIKADDLFLQINTTLSGERWQRQGQSHRWRADVLLLLLHSYARVCVCARTGEMKILTLTKKNKCQKNRNKYTVKQTKHEFLRGKKKSWFCCVAPEIGTDFGSMMSKLMWDLAGVYAHVQINKCQPCIKMAAGAVFLPYVRLINEAWCD